jgi:hypothetical protein
MFDEGLWTVDPRNRIGVANEVFTEWGPDARWLKSRHAWHRTNVFARQEIPPHHDLRQEA